MLAGSILNCLCNNAVLRNTNSISGTVSHFILNCVYLVLIISKFYCRGSFELNRLFVPWYLLVCAAKRSALPCEQEEAQLASKIIFYFFKIIFLVTASSRYFPARPRVLYEVRVLGRFSL